MENLTAWSTFALAIITAIICALTIGLVILAGVNFNKFTENVDLVAKGLKAQGDSIKLQSDSLLAQAKSIDLQSDSLKSQIRSIDLQSKSLEAQTEAINLQSKDILLNYKPVIFIKEVLPPIDVADISDPFKYTFVLTNSGKLPARNVQVSVTVNLSSGTNIALNNVIPIMQKASIYPGTYLMFQVPEMIRLGDKIDRLEIQFRILYMGDGFAQQMRENMKYILTGQTNRIWRYVGPQVDIFFKEKFNRKKVKYKDLANLEISEGRQRIIKVIVDGIFGIDKVLMSNQNELITSFVTVSKEIHEMKHFHTHGLNAGALTGLRSVGIIDQNDQLTLAGVSAFKCVAEIMKDEEIESNL